MSPVIPNVPGRLDGPPASPGGLAGATAESVAADSVAASRTEAEVRWRPSRHARRLFTLALAGLLLATLTRRPELAGVAAPALLLLGAAVPGRAGHPGRPGRVAVRVGLASSRLYEGELAAVDLAVDDARFETRWLLEAG